jgi:hypothetical protein
MTHPPISDPPGFDELSKPEQIRYLEALWDRISQNDRDIPVPDKHLEIAEQRRSDYRCNPQAAGSPYDVLDRLGRKKV